MQRFRWIALQGSSRGLLPPLLLFFLITTSGIPAHAADDPTACRTPVARVVSVQGSIEVLRAGQNDWSRVARLDTSLCEGDRLRTGTLSRAALFIQPETLVRVDQNTIISVSQTDKETLVEFIQEGVLPAAAGAYTCGAGYFITRFPRTFKVKTPHLNAAVEGTEFLVAMRCESTELSVFEGKVLAAGAGANVFPEQSISSGQVLTIGGSEPPAIKLLVKPADAVQWVVYYPPLSDATAEADLPAAEQCRSLPKPLDQTCLTQRAETLLRLGRVEEAQREVEEAVTLDPESGDANALRAIISIARNDKVGAIEAATAATAASQNSSRAWLALSYAQQASFKLEDSLSSARKAQALEPNSSVTNARVAELLMSLGRIKEAEKAARAAVEANPSESRAHTVLGFVRLAQINTKDARVDFLAAIERDSSDPMPRLGLGLAIIRDGKLAEGREQLEIAVALDPTNSLVRSYVGRAYFEERTTTRSKLAQEQFNLAEQFDPYDPTPLFYSATTKQADNRPIDALFDMQESVRRNDNRSVYRPRTALDQDAAARSVGIARLYAGLEFEESARTEVATALADDPTSFAAQQYLSDIAAFEDRQQSTRASAGLQAQLRQPLGADAPLVGLTGSSSLVPGRPYLSVESIGPQRPGLYDFDPVFSGPGIKARARGLMGEFGTASQELDSSITSEIASFTLGMLHAETDGQRVNNDQSRNAYAALATLKPTSSLTLQFDVQQSEATFGDLPIRWDPNFVAVNDRNTERFTTSRIGARGQLSPDSELLLAFTYAESKGKLTDDSVPFSIQIDGRFTATEVQYVHHAGAVNVVAGISSIDGTRDNVLDFPGFFTASSEAIDREQTGYVYTTLTPVDERLKIIAGAAWDNARLNSILVDDERTHPKLGILFQPTLSTVFRIAYFGMTQRPLPAGQTLEPVQVAGFSQMYDDPFGTAAKQIAGAIDQKFGQRLYLGANAASRRMDIPYTAFDSLGQPIGATTLWTENIAAGYIRWLPTNSIALSLQVVSEDFERTQENQGTGAFLNLKQLRAPATVQWFSPRGVTGSVRVNYLHQDGIFCAFGSATCDLPGEETSTITDLGLTYRFPRRAGSLSLDLLNIFDEQFRYQSVDTSTLVPFTGRAVFARVSLTL